MHRAGRPAERRQPLAQQRAGPGGSAVGRSAGHCRASTGATISGASIASSSALRTCCRNRWTSPSTISRRISGSFRPRDSAR